jgi:hypothetical protein
MSRSWPREADGMTGLIGGMGMNQQQAHSRDNNSNACIWLGLLKGMETAGIDSARQVITLIVVPKLYLLFHPWPVAPRSGHTPAAKHP